MKKTTKHLLILILIFIATVMIPILSNATTGHVNVGNYKPNQLKDTDVTAMSIYAGRIVGAIQVIGTIVSVGSLMVIGIRYMVSSAEEKAEYKERLFPYAIGAVLLFAASNLVNIIYSVVIKM